MHDACMQTALHMHDTVLYMSMGFMLLKFSYGMCVHAYNLFARD